MPDTRVIVWGYDAHTHSKSRLSCQYLYDHARTLVSDLYLLRARTNALIHSDASRRGALEHHRSIKVSTHGIIFMGTPHWGGNNVALGQLLTSIASIFMEADDRILQHLQRDSEWLQQQLGQYGPISNEFVTKYAYEEYETNTKLGHKMMVVPRSSAVVPGQADAEPIAIHADHIHMVKFASREDNGYKKISGHLQLMAVEAGKQVRSRWEIEAKVDEVRNEVESHEFALPFSLSEVTEANRFIGRKDEVLQLHRGLDATQDRRIAALHGLGGIGKTQLATAYLQSYRANYSAIIWLNAREETSLEQSFARAAKRILHHYPSLVSIRAALEGQEPQEIVKAVKRWLDKPRNDRWLLVFDNYDKPKLGNEQQIEDAGENRGSGVDEESPSQAETMGLKAFDVRPFFPDCYQGSIIITTRSSITGIGNSIFLRKLTDTNDGLEILSSTSHRHNLTNGKKAPQYFKNRADLVPRQGCYQAARRLDGLPLALATAGAYLNQVSISWAEYLDMYETSWLRLQRTSPGLLSYENRALHSTWDMSYSQIERKNPAAAMLLKLWAYLNKDDLWYELLRYEDDEVPTWFADMVQDRISFNEVMRVLCDHGLVEVASSERAAESQGYSVHECVHSWMVSALNSEQDATMARLALSCVASHVPIADVDAPDRWQIQRRLLLHADICASHISRLVQLVDGSDSWILHRFANLYAAHSRLMTAEAMYDQALRGYEKELGPEHKTTLNTVNGLGRLYTNQGRHWDAEAMYQGTLQGYEKELGPEHMLTLNTVNCLGNLYGDQGRHIEAEAMYDRALQGYEKELGPEHMSTLNTVLNLGVLYMDQGRHREAEAMYNRALQGFEKNAGPGHMATLDAVNNFGVLYVAQGRYGEAEAMYNRALRGYEKELGLEHLSTSDTIDNLGNLYLIQGRHTEARAMYVRALQGYEQALGPAVNKYDSALAALEKAGNLFKDMGDLEQARTYHARALPGLGAVFGREHERYRRVSDRLRRAMWPLRCMPNNPKGPYVFADLVEQ
ncbi:P-loop containing nucleoside triphosphate hydrolase protein [Dactylonectria estremocensis]|uniref:P-loop containing nucleoside triphosphate hydrolase protein n=1 Tax=Dactylonectria estremocensis TaxID=1079267 RepID=A0A9P9F2E0_9HYPO|nr:P-loop containing nucleoside triphosphate hydrolase protein [Dactylonectria estremocensis]